MAVAFQKAVAHGIVRAGMASLRGQKVSAGFWSGFVASGFSAPKSWGIKEGTFVNAVVGGTTSELTGGKFANGAVTGAFVHLFNSWGGDPIMKRALGDPNDKFDFFKDTIAGRVLSGIGSTFYKIGIGLDKSLSSLEGNIYTTYKNNPLGLKMGQMLFLKSNANGESALKITEISDIYNGVGMIKSELKDINNEEK